MTWKTLKRLGAAISPVRVAMTLSVVARSVFLVADVALVVIMTWLVVSVATGSVGMSWMAIGGLAALAGIKAVARYWEQYLGHYVAFGLLAAMRSDFFASIVPLVPAGIGDSDSGDLTERVMGDVDRVEVFYAHTLAPVITAVVVPVVALAVVATAVDLVLAVWLGVFLFAAGFVVPLVGWRLGRHKAEKASDRYGRLGAHLTDGIHGIGDVVLFGYGERRLKEMTDLGNEVATIEAEAAAADSWRAAAFDLVSGLALVGVAWYGSSLLDTGTVDLPTLAAVFGATLVLFVPVRDLQSVRSSFDRAMASAQRIFEVTDRVPVVVDKTNPERLDGRLDLTFENVSFSYPRTGVVVSDVDLSVAPGRRVGVVGASGAGKSTLPRLATRLWDTESGAVRVGGVDISGVAMADLRRNVAVVTQQAHLVDGSVADNISLGRPDTDFEAVAAAARAARADDFIEALPGGFDFEVGEAGSRLSGGQRQRIALARAILRDPPILILDEVTSELDTETEAEVVESLKQFGGDKAVLMIAHRLTTVVDCDVILVMDRGAIVERGRHQELLAAGGLYSRLWARQLDTLP